MRWRLLGGALAWIGCSAAAAPAVGQTSTVVPESPAFTYLSLSPTKASHPATARGLGAALAMAVDSTGRTRLGFAVDAAPWVWIPGLKIPADEYGNPASYALANTTVSFGTSGAQAPDGPTDLALGLRTTFVDRSDPMRDPSFRDDLRAGIAACEADPEADPADVRGCVGQRIERLRSEWVETAWNRASLSAAVATGWRFPTSRLATGARAGWAAWVSGALPLWSAAQLAGQLTYESRWGVGEGEGDREHLTGAARVNVGASWVNGFAEMALTGTRGDADLDDRTWHWGAGVEFRAADALWLSTGFGSNVADDSPDRFVVIANIRWRVSPAPRLAP
jgi:hypothetical protein